MSLKDPAHLLNRRQWTRRFVLGSAMALGLRTAWRGVLLADIGASTDRSSIIPVTISDYPDLEMVGGSIQLQFTDQAAPITINHGSDMNGGDVFFAVDSRCTHAGCTVAKWAPGVGMECPCHGSTYDIDGRLTYGFLGPGQGSLRQFNTAFDGNDLLKIEVPDLNLKINSIAVHSSTPTGRRLRLSFPGLAGSDYRVRRTPDLLTPSQPVPFAITESGTATVTQVNVSGGVNTEVSVWVDDTADRGYYFIELIVTQVG